jgi:hypothetical protein
VTGVTALTAEMPRVAAGSGPGPRGASTARTARPDPSGSAGEDRSAAVTSSRAAVRSWPLLVLAVPAAAEVWSGWVGIAQKTGFGMVAPLPGIWPSLHLDTSITLPVGVEAYAAYALRAWLAGEHAVSPRTRRFAQWSAMLSFALGMAGQVTSHLLAGAGVTRAPWAITTIVSCLPVLVLAMGTALAHMLRADGIEQVDSRTGPPAGLRSLSWSAENPDGPDRRPPQADQERSPGEDQAGPPQEPRADQAWIVARELAQAGKRVSRRALREGGVDRPGFFGGPCLPDMTNLLCFPAVRSSFARILSGECICRRSADARCYTSRPIRGSRA